MNVVNAVNKAEIAMMHAVLAKKFGQLYADIWKVGVNLLLRIKAERSNPYGHSVCWPPKNFSTKSFSIAGHPPPARGFGRGNLRSGPFVVVPPNAANDETME